MKNFHAFALTSTEMNDLNGGVSPVGRLSLPLKVAVYPIGTKATTTPKVVVCNFGVTSPSPSVCDGYPVPPPAVCDGYPTPTI